MPSRTDLTNWPNTSADPAPQDHLYRSATWLLGRHPMLAELAARAQVTYIDPDDHELSFDPHRLTDGFEALEEWSVDNAAYWQRHAGATDDAYDRLEQDAPKFPDTKAGQTAKAIAPMSGSEVVRLRILATFSWPGVRINVSDFGRLDDSGQDLLKDWCRAVLAA